MENNRIADARAWVMKYLREASEENKFFLLFIRGIIDNKLISKPIHIPTHVFADTAISVPITIKIKNMILYNLTIKKKRVKTYINGV